MKDKIFGIGTCANLFQVEKWQIQRFIESKKVKPQKVLIRGRVIWLFHKKDQEAIWYLLNKTFENVDLNFDVFRKRAKELRFGRSATPPQKTQYNTVGKG